MSLTLSLFFQYLYNLDPNSAYYDPKTRSMRENPFKESEGTQNKYVHYKTLSYQTPRAILMKTDT